MSKELSYLEAIREALVEEMRRDPKVFVLGEDVGAYGGAFGVTQGLYEEFGELRVVDTPISESAIVGISIGASQRGYRPVAEMQFADFISCGFDQIVNQAATLRFRYGGRAAVEILVLEVHHRVVVADRRLQQPLGVVCRRRRDHFQPGPMDEPGLRILRVIETAADIAAARRPDDDRYHRAAAIAEPQRRRLVDDLIEAARDEIGELHLGDRTIAALRRADADPDDRRLRDRRVDDAEIAELFVEALRHAEGAAVGADILAEHEYFRVAAHFFGKRLANRFQVRQLFTHDSA